MMRMNEIEWNKCTAPRKMLSFLLSQKVHRTDAGKRKLRLLCCACARLNWEPLTPNMREAIVRGERFIDGEDSSNFLSYWSKLTGEEAYLNYASRRTIQEEKQGGPLSSAQLAAREKLATLSPMLTLWDIWSSYPSAHRLAEKWLGNVIENGADLPHLCEVLRDLFGNVFSKAIVDPGWLTWNQSVVRCMAKAAYDDDLWADLPVLADALEEAGCTNVELLHHLRSPGIHVRGCWALDLLLGRS